MKQLDDYKKYLTGYFIKENGITDKTPFTIEEIDARKLIVPERIDLVAKWLYIDFRERKLQSPFAAGLYKEHLAAFSMGTFNEPGSPEKDSLDKYLDTFNTLIDEIKENGFDDTKSLVPVGDDNVILDGAHRVAACAYFDKPIKVIRFTGLTRDFGYDFFAKRGLAQKYLDSLIVEYCKLKPNTYALCLWPQAYSIDKFKAAHKIIASSNASIVAKKETKINYWGMKNLLLQIYGHHPWVGSHHDGFKGTERKVNEVHASNDTIAVYILEAPSLDKVLAIKDAIRNTYKIGNSSVHITDNQAETLQVASLLFNQNSLHHINHAKVDRYTSTHALLEEFKGLLNRHDEPRDHYAIDSSSILSIYGIRDANDLDYLSTSSANIDFEHPLIDSHDSQLPYYYLHKDDLVHNPDNYFVFSDIKFVSLDQVLRMKNNRGEQKDKDDLRLVNSSVGDMKSQKADVFFLRAKIYTKRAYGRNKTKTVVLLDSIGLKKPLVKIRNRLKSR